jgi:hypothetical protein
MDHRAPVDEVAKSKHPSPIGNQPPVIQLVVSSFTDIALVIAKKNFGQYEYV